MRSFCRGAVSQFVNGRSRRGLPLRLSRAVECDTIERRSSLVIECVREAVVVSRELNHCTVVALLLGDLERMVELCH